MNFFSAGIAWDPREPVPPQYPTAVSVAAVLPTQWRTGPVVCALTPQPVAGTKRLPSSVVKEIDRNVLPAASISIEARIMGDIAEVTARQVFWNDSDLPIPQGSYTFGLPNGCTVTGFTCRVGNEKVLKATARPKGEAREAFQRAVASHATAALLDQNTPEIFTSSLGNIPPNTRIKTEITYTAILKRRFGEDTNTETLIIPTYIANRYGERPVSIQGLNLETKPDDVLLRIEIIESEQIQSIKSISHEILVERSMHTGQAYKWDHIGQETCETAIVTMKEASTWLETDFILSVDTICSKGIDVSEAWLEMHPTFEDQAATMVTLPPRVLLSQNDISEDGEILFVADRSGSMEDKMKNLRSAMHFFLKGIPVGRIFNVWCFGSHYQPLWTKSQVYGQESLQQALDFVDTKFHADMGGTEILPALEAIIAARDPSLPCDVVVLTDGEVWRLDETLSLVRRANESSKGAIRFFSLGLGDHVSHALVEGIAKQGGGCSEIIPRADKEGWEERVVAILKASLTRHVRNLSLDLGGLKGMTSPGSLKSLNLFEANRVFLLLEEGKIPEDESVTLTFVSDGKCTPIGVSITRVEKPGMLIHKLAARAVLDDLERGLCSNTSYRPGRCLEAGAEEEDSSRIAEDLACKYSLPSKWTSLFLSQENDESTGSEATSITIAVAAKSRTEDIFLRSRGVLCSKGKIPVEFLPACRGPPISRPSMPSIPMNPCQFPIRPDLTFGLPSPKENERTVMMSPIERLYGDSGYTGYSSGYSSPNYYNYYSSNTEIPAGKVSMLAETGLKGIALILSHQAFDGSIASGVLKELPKGARDIIHSLKVWLREKTKTHLTEVAIDLVANTALTVAFLERDYQECKNLWVMIQEKALAYIRLQVSPLNLEIRLMEYSRESLKGVERPTSLKRKTSTSDLSVQKCKKNRGLNAEDKNNTDSDRVSVHEAPID